MVKFNADPTKFKIVMIAIAIFIYSFTVQSGVMTVLADRMPYPNEWILFVFSALGADVVYILTFLGLEVPAKEPNK